MPDGILIKDVWVEYQEDAVTAGQAYVYLFPTGMAQRAVIHLTDEDENEFTLWVEALTGRVRIYPERVEAPDE